MDHALHELLVFSVMMGTGAAASVARTFLRALAGHDQRRRVTPGGAAGDVLFSLFMAGIVVAALFRLNYADVRFYALAGFGGGLWGSTCLLGPSIRRGAQAIRRGVSRLTPIFPTRKK